MQVFLDSKILNEPQAKDTIPKQLCTPNNKAIVNGQNVTIPAGTLIDLFGKKIAIKTQDGSPVPNSMISKIVTKLGNVNVFECGTDQNGDIKLIPGKYKITADGLQDLDVDVKENTGENAKNNPDEKNNKSSSPTKK